MPTDNGGMEVLRTEERKFHPDAPDPFAPYRTGGETPATAGGAETSLTELKKCGLPGLELCEPWQVQPVGPVIKTRDDVTPGPHDGLQPGDARTALPEGNKIADKTVQKEGEVGTGSADPNSEKEK